MSLIVFGSLIFSSEEEKINAQEQKTSIGNCYMRTGCEVAETTYNVSEKLFYQRDFHTETFELSDGPYDNTATKLFAPKYYCELNGEWKEKTPTLFERLELVQNFLEEIFF